MKLINKTQRVYLLLVAVLLLVWSGVFMYAISFAVRENIDETLHSELLALVSQTKAAGPVRTITTRSIVITPIPNVQDAKIAFSDTTLINSVEHEPFSYRQVQTETVIQGQPYRITMRRSLVEYDDLFEAILIVEFIFLVLLIAGLFTINRNILRRVWEPFYHTLAEVGRYKIGRNEPIEWRETEIDEFQQLNRVLNEMIAQIEHEYKSLKQFTENASHEIQTPLSVISNKVEMLLQDESLTSEQGKNISTIYQTAGKLSRLNKALLMLTKIENEQYNQKENVNISQLLEELMPDYQTLAQSKNISFKKNIEPGVQINMNAELAELMFRNLLGNAVKHNHPDGKISLQLNQNHFLLCNTGTTSTENPQQFFERFKKAKGSRESLGLGLSIVSAIAEANKFELNYRMKGQMHEIEIQFNNRYNREIKTSLNE